MGNEFAEPSAIWKMRSRKQSSRRSKFTQAWESYWISDRQFAPIHLKVTPLTKTLDFPWPRNVLRHSYISYRIAVVKSAEQVALEAGNSPAIIFRHYRELATEEQARHGSTSVPSRPRRKNPHNRCVTTPDAASPALRRSLRLRFELTERGERTLYTEVEGVVVSSLSGTSSLEFPRSEPAAPS